jgi:cytoskeletal protein RodZ
MRVLCVLAAALLTTLVFAACGGSDEPTEAASPPPAATTTEPSTEPTTPAETETEPAETETEPAETETEPAETETEPAETETEPPATTEDRFDVDVQVQVVGGERAGGEGRIEAKRDDRVRIEIAVDEPQELHLHGYELSRNATPNKPAVFRFRANLEGIFELESHLSHAVIVNLVVEP